MEYDKRERVGLAGAVSVLIEQQLVEVAVCFGKGYCKLSVL